ncbi:MAG TPA: glycosyl transferase, partial [Alphaproteobacteria bacterium]|nr:glycosyl transferase [Alphaproteobacteria bacterium]
LDRLLVGISDVFGVMWLLRRGPQQGLVSEIGTTAARTENGRKDAAR